MDCQEKIPGLVITVGDEEFEIEFAQLQLEITNRCNMRCIHCRTGKKTKLEMPVPQAVKALRFVRRYSPNYKEVLTSGGEPLTHSHFKEMMAALRVNGAEFVTLTTNGWYLTQDIITFLHELRFERLQLSISLDSLTPQDHDNFRQKIGAWQKAIEAIELIAANNHTEIISSIRSTLRPHQIEEMEGFVLLAKKYHCKRMRFASVIPAGNALKNVELQMTQTEKHKFLTNLYALKAKYPEINISTSDPLKCLLRNSSDMASSEDELVFDGCTAGSITLNIKTDGTMTPCALVDYPMMNIYPLSIDEIEAQFVRNEWVKKMLTMDFGGKCGQCTKKYQCGGCRARAYAATGDWFASDPHCFR